MNYILIIKMISEKNPNFFSREDTVVPRGYAGELLESRCRCTGVPQGLNHIGKGVTSLGIT